MHAFSMPKRQNLFLSSVLRGDIQNYCKFELQSPDNMTIVNKLLYIDSYYLASMVIFSNVLKQLFGKRLFQNNFSPRIIKLFSLERGVNLVNSTSLSRGPRASSFFYQPLLSLSLPLFLMMYLIH